MEEISAGIVFRLLDHITDEIPGNLISKPLLQRHHFLGLTPHDSEYLVWPSGNQSHVLQLLSTEPLPSQEQTEHLSVRYTSDKEHLLAHVRITPELRLVFLWDLDHKDWRYHNVDTMPCPINSYSNFSDAVAVYSPDDFLQEQSYDAKVAGDQDEGDDSYWNSYSQGDDQDSNTHLPTTKSNDNLNSEDAYWARYSTIQGTADSTIPSPLPVHKNPPQSISTDSNQLPDRIIIPPDEFSANHVELYNPLEPPSPEALSRRLEALSTLVSIQPSQPPSRDPSSPPLFDDSPETSDSDTASPPISLSDSEVTPPVQAEPEMESSPSRPVADEFVVVNAEEDQEDPAQKVLQDNIRNLYQLWRLGRAQSCSEADRKVFLRNVHQALEAL